MPADLWEQEAQQFKPAPQAPPPAQADEDWRIWTQTGKRQPDQPDFSTPSKNVVGGRTLSIPASDNGILANTGRFLQNRVNALGHGFERMTEPGIDPKLGGASEVVREVGKAALPLAVPSVIQSPLRAGASLAVGTGVGTGVEQTGKALFPDHPGAAEAAGTAAGITAGGLTIPGLNRGPSLAPRPEVSLSRGSTIPGDIIQPPASISSRPSLGRTAADMVGLISPRARYGLNVLRGVRDLFGGSGPATQPGTAQPGTTAPAPRPLFPATSTPATPGLPPTRTPLGMMPSGDTIPSPVAGGPRIIELKDPETGRPYGHINLDIPEEDAPNIPFSRIQARLAEADQPAVGSKPVSGTQPAAKQGTLKRAEINEYNDAVSKAGFKSDPASLPGNQAGVSLSSSFVRNARGQAPPTAVRTFQSQNLPAFAARENLAPEEAVRRLKAAGFLIRK